MSKVYDDRRFPRVGVVGSRDFSSQFIVERFVYLLPSSWTIITGGAKGVDLWAEHTASHHMRGCVVYHADWRKFGRSAGYIRNNQIVKDADIVVAFWNGKSKGTRHTIQLSKNLGKSCIVVKVKND